VTALPVEQTTLDDLLREAERQRDQALAAVEAGTDAWTRIVIDQAIIGHAEIHGTVSANDFRDLLPEIGDRSKIGTRMRALATSKRLIWVTSEPSTSAATHAHRIGRYRLATSEDNT
jgi:hypothetical protein